MTDVNHRRDNRLPVNQRHTAAGYHNGYAHPDSKEPGGCTQRVGRTDFLDKSLHGWGRVSKLADRSVGAHIGNDFSKGHRGMARAVAGAKKFVRTRIRFHEKAYVRKIAREGIE